MTLSTRPTSLEAGVTVALAFLARSALRMTVNASASGSFCMSSTSGVRLESQIAGGLAEAVAAQAQPVAAHHGAHLAAAAAAFVDSVPLLACLDWDRHLTTSMLNAFERKAWASS